MNFTERQETIQELFDNCLFILEKKGADYSSQADALDNFKKGAEALGLTKYEIWAVYWKKHVDSVLNSIKRNSANPQTESEPLEERIKDIINYSALLYCLLKEDKKDAGAFE